MNTMSIAKLAASTIVLSTMMVGCSIDGSAQRPANVSDAQAVRTADSAARRADKAIAKAQFAKAVLLAEAAVEAQPRDAGYRMLLGRAYLGAGRFQSAERSFSDTLTLDPQREKAALNLALVQIALGKDDAARSTLADYRDKLAASDFGLALALAGDHDEAVRVLEFAAKAPDATATTRQNLALAYALDGKWANARVMAVQDLSVDDASARLGQWAMYARPGGAPAQVAALLGTVPSEDAGQPTRLALAPAAAEVQTASAEVPIPPAVPEAAAEPAAVATPVAFEAPVPAHTFAAVPAAPVAVPSAPAHLVKPAVKPAVAAPGFPIATIRPVTDGKFMVQLGAFANAAIAEHAWNRDSRALGLATYEPVNGTVKAGNASFVRLSIGGFGTRNDAGTVCAHIKQSGKTCFVRLRQGDAPARWAQRKTYKVAAR